MSPLLYSMRILRYTDDLFLHISLHFRRCIVCMSLLRCIRIPRPQQRQSIDTSLCIFRRCVCISFAVSESLVPSNDNLLIHLFAFSGAVYVSPSLYPNPSSPATTTYYDTSTYTGLTTSPQSQLVSYAGTLQRKSSLCIPSNGLARPQAQFTHSCVCK